MWIYVTWWLGPSVKTAHEHATPREKRKEARQRKGLEDRPLEPLAPEVYEKRDGILLRACAIGSKHRDGTRKKRENTKTGPPLGSECVVPVKGRTECCGGRHNTPSNGLRGELHAIITVLVCQGHRDGEKR